MIIYVLSVCTTVTLAALTLIILFSDVENFLSKNKHFVEGSLKIHYFLTWKKCVCVFVSVLPIQKLPPFYNCSSIVEQQWSRHTTKLKHPTSKGNCCRHTKEQLRFFFAVLSTQHPSPSPSPCSSPPGFMLFQATDTKPASLSCITQCLMMGLLLSLLFGSVWELNFSK
jgi:hypothetical protein